MKRLAMPFWDDFYHNTKKKNTWHSTTVQCRLEPSEEIMNSGTQKAASSGQG